MQERRLRLGDVLDDYCPREKRLTNHVIVALVEDEVRQTRCTTCDTEHPYKQGRVPVRRKKADASAVLFKQVLDNLAPPDTDVPDVLPALVAAAPPALAVAEPEPVVQSVAGPALGVADETDRPPAHNEPVHRHQLIRATLPKIEGQVQERKPADFTMWNVSRHAQARRGRAPRAGAADGNAGYSPFGNGHPKAPVNDRGRQAQGKGQGHGHGQSQGQPSRRNRRGR